MMFFFFCLWTLLMLNYHVHHRSESAHDPPDPEDPLP